MQQELEQFTVHMATSIPPSHNNHHQTILKNCKKLEDRLVRQKLSEAVRDLLSFCGTQYLNGVKGQIFPVQLHKNQEEELGQFLDLLQQELKERKELIFRERRERMVEERKEEQRIQVVFLEGGEIRDLVLQIYIFLQEHPHHEMVIFIARSITDLSQHNLYCFQKALKNKRFAAVMSTFSTFQTEVESLSHKHYQKYHISLYHPKQLFCRFVYECITLENIKAYLPDGILTLISDMDFYSLSFRQSCRRFRYCFERSLMLSHRERIWVNFDGLVTLIEEVISKEFEYYCGYKNPQEKLLKVILSQKQNYTISEKAVSYEVAMNTRTIDQNHIINSIRHSLEDHLNKEPAFRGYAQHLIEHEDQPQQQVRKKKSRADQLGIDTKKNITAKNRLENQITKIIKQATQSIRTQASFISWQQIKYNLRIRPEIPLLVTEAYIDEEETSKLTGDILSEYAAPVSKYVEQWDKEDVGRFIYLLKTLEISGLIDVVKKQHRPTICISFFEKSHFSGHR